MRRALLLCALSACASEPSRAPDAATIDAALGVDAAPEPDIAAAAPDRVDAMETSMPSTDASASVFALESPGFTNDGTLPVAHTCDGAGQSPPLAWRDAPGATIEYALMMTVQARDGLKWNWVLYGIPASVRALPAAAMGVGTSGLTSDGPNLAYSPPCSQGPGPMRYTFTLYALSARPTLPSTPRMVTGAVLTSAIASLTLAQASMSVTYTR